MKDITVFITENKLSEFEYAESGDHDFIDEIIEILNTNGYKQIENKTIKSNQYKITNNGYELFIRSEVNKSLKKTTLICIRKGKNDKYDYYYKSSNDSFWRYTFSKKQQIIRFRDYQHSDNGIFDVKDSKWHDRILQSIRGILKIRKNKET